MKMLAMALVVAATSALADIPTPTVDQLTVSGAEAAALAAQLPGQYRGEGQENGPFGKSEKKQWSTKGGLTKITCTKVTVQNRVKSEHCLIQKSANGVGLNGPGFGAAPGEELPQE